MIERNPVLTVSQVNEYLRMLIDSNDILNSISVRGEISNFKYYQSSGHMYFSLKDESGIMRAVMFKTYASKLRFHPQDGMKVVASGKLGVYSQNGVYQLYVSSMEEDGLGKKALELEKLRKKLYAEGLFDESRKRSLPLYPFSIGVITSPNGAAIHDIINVISRRFAPARIILCPAAVQGINAGKELREAAAYFNKCGGIDLLIIGRGGGSGEDLSAFNDEMLVRELAKSPVPVISAVGHETDFTLCDFVADSRAPTPSAAAELACPDIEDILSELSECENSMKSSMKYKIRNYEELLGAKCALLESHSTSNAVKGMKEKLTAAERNFEHSERIFIDNCIKAVENKVTELQSLNPLSVLKRGYSYSTKNGTTLRSVKQIESGEKFVVSLSDGEICATAESKVIKE